MMLDRLIDCLCHPKWIGKYNKDKASIVFLTFMIFFLLYLIVFGVRCYTEQQFNESAYRSVASAMIRQDELDNIYQDHKLIGTPTTIKEDGFLVYILPEDDKAVKETGLFNFSVQMVLYADKAEVYYGIMRLSSIDYKDIDCPNFDMKQISLNNDEDIYYFKIFIAAVLNSSNVAFQTMNFVNGAISSLFYYLIIVLCACFYATFINPTIDKPIRIKLVFYDSLIYFVVNLFASLFNFGWLTYVAIVFPLIYVTITFRHIVKVVVKR